MIKTTEVRKRGVALGTSPRLGVFELHSQSYKEVMSSFNASLCVFSFSLFFPS
jgi:hypothetical protein